MRGGGQVMSRLNTLKSAIHDPPGSGLAGFNVVLNSKSNSTRDLAEAMKYASLLMTDELELHRDLYHVKEVQDVGQSMTELYRDVYALEYGHLRPWPESQWRAKYKEVILGCVKLRRKMRHTGQEVRSRLAKAG